MGVDLPPRAPAKAAKARQRSSVTPAQRLAAEDAAIKAKEPTRKASVVARATPALVAAHAAVDTTDTEVYGRVRMHAVPKADGAAGGDGRRNCLSEKGWARRAVVVHSVGPSGAANFAEAPGRDGFALGDDGAQQHEEAFLEYVEGNFDDAGAEVRSLDYRDRKVGLFGDWLECVGHGKYLEWVKDDENNGLWKLQAVRTVRGAQRLVWPARAPHSHVLALCAAQGVEVEVGTEVVRRDVPLVPSAVSIMEYAIKAAIGDASVPKGGRPEYRSGPWYKSLFGGRRGGA